MNDQYLTVTALTKYIKRKIDIDPHLNQVWLKGEISNFNHHSRGHMYLTIKDDQTRIQAVMFAGNNRRLKFTPENGMNVLIKGEISVFEPYGQYQLYVQQMEPDGLGALYLAYEQLKGKLANKGYFEAAFKKEIPKFPTHIGIVTSPTGAAVRDIITTIKRRYPIVQTTVIPAIVQGEQAAPSIKSAIEQADRSGLFDVLIVGRGGGSIEELWGFNEEIVCDAIFKAATPIISAVGHETDHTISDMVADLRAPTPTGAAELAVPSQQELTDRLSNKQRRLNSTMRTMVNHYLQVIERISQSYAFRYPGNLVKQKEQELDRSAQRLERSLVNLKKKKIEQYNYLYKRLENQHPEEQWKQEQINARQLSRRFETTINQLLEQKVTQLVDKVDKLTLLNPLEIMKRGFSISYDAKGKLIHSSKQVQPKDKIVLQVSDGSIDCEVVQVKEN